ncbi:hypothetical protein [Ktedonobacter racemifer]|nr:hypothetical protein [Ktedonobacter racemifer]
MRQHPLPTVSDASGATTQSLHRARQALKKVPEVTVFFWILKLLTTAFGESSADYLFQVFGLKPLIALAIGTIGLIVALILQLTARRYIAWIYWFAVAMVAVFGTMAADVAHVGLGVPYQASTMFFVTVLAVIFVTWYVSEKTLSIHSISTRRRELFYWGAVMATFALGTAAGDLTAKTLGWGYFSSTLLFLAVIAVPALGYWKMGLNGILAFWFAYIVTRPLGASFADWMGKATLSGLGLGDKWVSLALALAAIGFVWYLTVTRKDMQDE